MVDDECNTIEMGRQGKGLTGTARRIVYNVSEFMALEKRAGRSILRMNVIDRVAKACQLSRSTVATIRRQGRSGEKFKTPTKRYSNSRTQILVDDFDRQAIRRSIHAFYERHEYPTLTSLLADLKSRQLFQGGRSTLHVLLREMGFRYRKHQNRRYILEQPHITQQRHTYLRAMRENRLSEHPRPTIYLDETWCNSRHGRTHMWVDGDGNGGFKHPGGKGPRLIIVHAGGEAGWISKSDLIFRAKAKSGDFHSEMNAEHFLEWFEYQLCPHVPAGSLIVLDNASYHNTQREKIPSKSSRKSEMKEWLSKHGIEYSESDLKADLMEKIVKAKPTKVFETDVIAAKFTHKVLRLPVAHPELNPIELAWAEVKAYVAKHNKTFTLKEVERLVPEAIDTISPAKWHKFCQHTVAVEDEYWAKDGLVEDVVEEILLNIGDESESEISDDETEVDCVHLQRSSSEVPTESGKELSSRRRLQLEPTTFPQDFLKSVLPLTDC